MLYEIDLVTLEQKSSVDGIESREVKVFWEAGVEMNRERFQDSFELVVSCPDASRKW